MKKTIASLVVSLMLLGTFSLCNAENIVRLSTINWEPYTGEKLPSHGFFSKLVVESFARAGYKVEFFYLPWARALLETKKGNFDGVMTAYWKKERTEYLHYPDTVYKVKENFVALKSNSINYAGILASLKGYSVGVLNRSIQAEELEKAGIKTQPISDQAQNVNKLLLGRIDTMLIPTPIFFYHLKEIAPKFDNSQIKILHPPYKIYDMFVAFSKKRQNYKELTEDFNKGLNYIKADGSYEKIVRESNIRY
ncbi:MAG: ABC transporter substrate-binding protein [Desulfobacterales bacterium]|nr:ABC transporter substrate-binding protein [Desulfobacterales bacterium]